MTLELEVRERKGPKGGKEKKKPDLPKDRDTQGSGDGMHVETSLDTAQRKSSKKKAKPQVFFFYGVFH